MNIGEKIKSLRKSRGLTQAELGKNIVTRNMLCAIENGNANPSLDTLIKIAERLDVPAAYLLSDDEDVSIYRKNEKLKKITAAMAQKNYKWARELLLSIGTSDDEIAYLIAYSSFKLAEVAVKNGSLKSAKSYLVEFNLYRKKTVYDLSLQAAISEIYSAISTNIKSPLLEFNESAYEKVLSLSEYEYYKYLTLDFAYPYKTPPYKNHLKAKQLIKERKYTAAIPLLLEIAENKNPDYDAYLIFGVYTDLELCYRQLYDYESAYRYSTKRMSLLESFNS